MSYETASANEEMVDGSLGKIHGERTGLFFHHLQKYLTNVTMKGRGNKAIAKVTLELPMAQIGDDAFDDARLLMHPGIFRNDLIPMLVFVDPKKAERFIENLHSSNHG